MSTHSFSTKTTVAKEQKLNQFVQEICLGARANSQRTGQYLFNHLPPFVGRKVASTSFDPFHKDLTEREIYDWLDEHLIFDGYEIIAVFHNNRILWSK